MIKEKNNEKMQPEKIINDEIEYTNTDINIQHLDQPKLH